jgi:FkbM family methyltransferase
MWRSALRALIRFYLSSFPLRDGKGRVYDAFNEKLLPDERFVIISTRYGFRLKLDLADTAQRKIYFFGDYDERHELNLLRRILLPGDIFWDIGANIGFYTLSASSLVRPQGRVVAFEPAFHAWQALTANLDLNHSDNVQPFQVALSDEPGEGVLYRRGDFADGGASLISRSEYYADSEVVTMTTLDQFLVQSASSAPTFMKIDVEGLEVKVLNGGKKIIGGPSPPLILLEMNDPAGIGTVLQGAGYQGAFLHRRRWYPAQSLAEVKSRNMLWFRPDSSLHRERLALINFYPEKNTRPQLGKRS